MPSALRIEFAANITPGNKEKQMNAKKLLAAAAVIAITATVTCPR